MEIIILDTDFLIELLNGNSETAEFLLGITNQILAITVITRAEIIQGARNKEHQTKLTKAIDDLLLIDLNTNISNEFTHLFAKYYLSHSCTIPDMLNASCAISKEAKLLILNIKDYKYISELKLLKYNMSPKSGLSKF